jgi:HEAT repeat protein
MSRRPRLHARAWHWVASLIAAIALLRVEPARARGGDDLFDPAVISLLSSIDHVPTRGELDAVMGPSPVEHLWDLIGIGEAKKASPGVRIRAVRALAQYPGDEARAALRAVITTYRDARVGVDLLLLRAAIEALGTIGGAAAVDDIAPFLEAEECRDLRATAALALGATGSMTAVPILSERPKHEPTKQVKQAITEALRMILD